ncbi:hypothetical protein [Solirhodobacter olei]|uniref:hypothetical protein n=1 Tax=Solirhodobacter olei TaxID=2493082 RepID=UPI000FD6D9D6|nr:hypothetical protein [Solirhodobacter olei]
MPRHLMYLYPWDLREDGADLIAQRLAAAGATGVALSASYHSGKFVRPHGQDKVVFPEGNTTYFRPDPRRYRRLVPEQAAMSRDFDSFRALAEGAPELSVTAWTIGLHNSRLGRLHPELAAQTVYGGPLVNSLCPSQPEVRHYLGALCADTAAQPGVCEIALEAPGWQAFRHGYHHEFELIELPEPVQVMLGTCFCAACTERARGAGLDLGRLARRTRAELDAFFADGTPPPTDPRTDAEWRALVDWRGATVAELATEVRAGLPAGVALAVIPTVQSPNSLCWTEGSDLSRLGRAADRLEVPAYQSGVAAILADAAEVVRAAGTEADTGFILRPTWPNLTDAAQVAEAVRGLRGLGASSISFYNYGHMRLQSLDWIAAALS